MADTIDQIDRLYFVYTDKTTGKAQQDANGKYIAYKAPEDWDAAITPTDLIALHFEVVLLDTLYMPGDCGKPINDPAPEEGAPVWKGGISVPGFVADKKFEWTFKLTDVATAAGSSVLSKLTMEANPSFMAASTTVNQQGVLWAKVEGVIPAATQQVPFALRVIASNSKSTPKSFVLIPKAVDEVTIYGIVNKLNGYVTVGVGPTGATSTDVPYITRSGPSGFTDTARQLMEVFGSPQLPALNYKETQFRKVSLAKDQPNGLYTDYIEHLGQKLYTQYTLTDADLSLALAFSADNPGATNPTPTPGNITWPAYGVINIKQNEYRTDALPGSTFKAETGFSKVETVGEVPAGFSLYMNINGGYAYMYTPPPTQAAGRTSAKIRVTMGDGRQVENTLLFNVQAVPFYAYIRDAYQGKNWLFIGPNLQGSGLPVVKVVQSPPNYQDIGERPVADFDAGSIDGKAYLYLNHEFSFTQPGGFVIKITAAGVTKWAQFPGNPTAGFALDLLDAEPAPAVNASYYANIPASGINEGSNGRIGLMRHVDGQPDSAVSGFELGTNSPHAGTYLAANGNVQIDYNSTPSDSYAQYFWIKLNGALVVDNAYFLVNDTSVTTTPVPITPVSTSDQSNEITTGYFESGHGAVVSLSLTTPTSMDEATGTQLTGSATMEDGTIITDLTLMQIALAAATGDFTTATTSAIAQVSGVKLGNNGLFTADINTTTGDTRQVRVRLTYGEKSATKSVTINDKTVATTPTPSTTTGAAAINVIAKSGADVSFVLTTSGLTETGGECFAIADASRRFIGGTDVTNSLVLGSYGYSQPAVSNGTGFYSFAFNTNLFRSRYPNLGEVAFDLYVDPVATDPYYINRVNYSYINTSGITSKTLTNGIDYEYANKGTETLKFWDYSAGSSDPQQNKTFDLHAQFTVTSNARKKIGTLTLNLSTGISRFVPINVS